MSFLKKKTFVFLTKVHLVLDKRKLVHQINDSNNYINITFQRSFEWATPKQLELIFIFTTENKRQEKKLLVLGCIIIYIQIHIHIHIHKHKLTLKKKERKKKQKHIRTHNWLVTNENQLSAFPMTYKSRKATVWCYIYRVLVINCIKSVCKVLYKKSMHIKRFKLDK